MANAHGKEVGSSDQGPQGAVIVTRKQGKESYLDQTQEDDDSIDDFVFLEKWGCLTRRVDEAGRVITVLAGHSRSVEGMADFLTQESCLRELKHKFRNSFTTQLQTRFRVTM